MYRLHFDFERITGIKFIVCMILLVEQRKQHIYYTDTNVEM